MGVEKVSTLGERMKELREERRISQVELGQICGSDRKTMIRMEKDKTSRTIAIIESMADYFDVSADYLLGRTHARNHRVEIVKVEVQTPVRKFFNPKWEV